MNSITQKCNQFLRSDHELSLIYHGVVGLWNVDTFHHQLHSRCLTNTQKNNILSRHTWLCSNEFISLQPHYAYVQTREPNTEVNELSLHTVSQQTVHGDLWLMPTSPSLCSSTWLDSNTLPTLMLRSLPDLRYCVSFALYPSPSKVSIKINSYGNRKQQ